MRSAQRPLIDQRTPKVWSRVFEVTCGRGRAAGGVEDLARAFTDGFVYAGRHSAHLDRRQGRAAPDVALGRMVVCSQNHDQVGNRPLGDRPTARLGADKLRLAATTMLLSPFLPLLFMGEEHVEAAPFAFFTIHTDPVVIERTRSARAMEFAAFAELLLHLVFNADTTTWTVPPGSWQVRLDTAGPPWGGRRTNVPDVIEGGTVLQLEPWSALVLTPRPKANR